MLEQSVLTNQARYSPLSGQSSLKPKGGRGQRAMVFNLSLTSLIDAFSILVIYLLMNFSATGEVVKVTKDVQLPHASFADTMEHGTVIRVSQNQYFIDDKEIPADQLLAKLNQIRESSKGNAEKDFPKLIIQADRRSDFNSLSPVIQAASHVGFSKFKFAVLQEGARQ